MNYIQEKFMAIDRNMQTTTGAMGGLGTKVPSLPQKTQLGPPSTPSAPTGGGGGVMARQKAVEESPSADVINREQFAGALDKLSENAKMTLDRVLTPDVKEAISEVLGPEAVTMLEPFGSDEPNVIIPVSEIANNPDNVIRLLLDVHVDKAALGDMLG